MPLNLALALLKHPVSMVRYPEGQLCVYCQQRRATEPDHVPPRALFPRPWPKDLIEVPSCSECNRGFSKDDEWFRAMLIMRRDVAEQAASQPLLDALFRAVARPQAKGLAELISRSMHDLPVVTRAGLLLGHTPAYTVDTQRFRRYLARIVRGLFYHETGEPLPSDVRVTPDVTFENNLARRTEVAEYIAGPLERVIGANIFGYTWRRTPTNRFTSVWLLVFYGVAPYLVLTVQHPSDAGA